MVYTKILLSEYYAAYVFEEIYNTMYLALQ